MFHSSDFTPEQLGRAVTMTTGALLPKPGKHRARNIAARAAGDTWEATIAASAMATNMLLFPLPRSGGRFVGKGRFVAEKMPFDYFGVIESRAIFFDAKHCGAKEAGLAMDRLIPMHQKVALNALAMAGQMAGLLVHCERMGDYRWLHGIHLMPWENMGIWHRPPKVVHWDFPGWTVLGPADGRINFERLVTP